MIKFYDGIGWICQANLEASTGEVVIHTFYRPGQGQITKVMSSDREKLVSWGKEHGMPEKWIKEEGIPHYQVWGKKAKMIFGED